MRMVYLYFDLNKVMMKLKHQILIVFLVAGLGTLAVLPSCNPAGRNDTGLAGDTLKGKITISGAFALYPLVVKCAEEFQKLHPRVTINVSAGGAGKGMTDALTKMVDLGMYSKAVSPEEQAKGAWWIAVAKDAVLPTINSANPVLTNLKARGLTRQKFIDIFISGSIRTWGQAVGNGSRAELQVFTRSDACGAADMWAKYLNNKKQEDILGLGVNGDPGVADAVRKNIGGIGFNNLGFVYEMQTRKIYPGLDVIPIDLDGNGKIDPAENFYGSLDSVMKAINDGRYPSPPARDLFLVSGGKPSSQLVKVFLKWILSDGQKFVNEAGYVTIKPEQITAELQKLN
jgi:phosphate transport system substrate-binding protein